MYYFKHNKQAMAAIVLIALAVLGVIGYVVDPSNSTVGNIALGALAFIFIAAILLYKPIRYLVQPAEYLWSKWAHCTGDEPQRIRMGRALDGKMAMQSMDVRSKCAVFIGGKGTKYFTTLSACSCPDFKDRKLPCKHMYRLANELGMPDLPAPMYTNNY